MEGEVKIIKPLLRWAGGKSWIVNELSEKLDLEFNDYHEPFLGGGSFFLHLKGEAKLSKTAYLNDANADLINMYQQIKSNVEEVCLILKKYKNTEQLYYSVRNKKFADKIEKAAQFIYLNRTCYNGIYRVNLRGEFNVPYGYKKYAQLFDYSKLEELNKLLKHKTRFTSFDFSRSLKNVKKGDLVFLDPPYTVNHENNGFIKYNEKIFSWEDQIRLKRYILEVVKRKAYFILTNAAHESIYHLFSPVAEPIKRARFSVVGGKNSSRGAVHEYIFSNCLSK